jgi:hypothetical protein
MEKERGEDSSLHPLFWSADDDVADFRHPVFQSLAYIGAEDESGAEDSRTSGEEAETGKCEAGGGRCREEGPKWKGAREIAASAALCTLSPVLHQPSWRLTQRRDRQRAARRLLRPEVSGRTAASRAADVELSFALSFALRPTLSKERPKVSKSDAAACE